MLTEAEFRWYPKFRDNLQRAAAISSFHVTALLEVILHQTMTRFSRSRHVSRSRLQQLCLQRRKEIVLFETSYASPLMGRMRSAVAKLMKPVSASVKTNSQMDSGRAQDHICWLNHEVKGNGTFQVKARLGSQGAWSMNFGTANLLIHRLLSNTQKLGIIYERWELSHLCGNWRCMNHNHHIVESKHTNLERMSCFKDAFKTCRHHPACLVYLQTNDGSYRSPSENTAIHWRILCSQTAQRTRS